MNLRWSFPKLHTWEERERYFIKTINLFLNRNKETMTHTKYHPPCPECDQPMIFVVESTVAGSQAVSVTTEGLRMSFIPEKWHYECDACKVTMPQDYDGRESTLPASAPVESDILDSEDET